MTISTGLRLDWYVWCEGWVGWQAVIVTPEVTAPLKRPLAQPPPATNVMTVVGGKRKGGTSDPRIAVQPLGEDVNPNTLTTGANIPVTGVTAVSGISSAQFIEREFARHKRKYRVMITSNNKTFETYTLDISQGGIQLMHPLPDWVIGYCQVRLLSKRTKEMIKVTCAVVENQNPSHRTRLQIIADDESVQRRLKQWFAA